jgi:uncharacterized membrane protein YeaQ/YmgE (transglycosylase-associated protein family)
MQCARHPKVETALSCGKCGTPICPDCSVVAPVGMRCRDCASMRSSPLYQVRPERFALAAVAGVAAGTLAGFVLQYVGFFILFVAPMIGGFLGEVILRATGRKRGARLEFLAGASVVIGAILSVLISGDFYRLTQPVSLVFFLLAVGLTAAAAVGKIRYL